MEGGSFSKWGSRLSLPCHCDLEARNFQQLQRWKAVGFQNGPRERRRKRRTYSRFGSSILVAWHPRGPSRAAIGANLGSSGPPSAMQAPPGQPDEVVLLAVCFRAWSDVTAEESRRIVPVQTSRWSARRCLVWHMYDRRGSFAPHLVQLRDMLLSSVKTRAFRDTCGLIAVSLLHMDKIHIKRMSYLGAVALKRPSGNYVYADPGNFVYALWWLLCGSAAKHVLKQKPRDTRCRAYLWCMRKLRERWPLKDDTPRQCERIGDIVELVLACAYIDAEAYWHIQTVLGPIILKVAQFVHHLEYEARMERMHVEGSFFSGMPSRCSCTSKLASAMWYAMNVQKYNVDMSSPEAAGFLKLCTDLCLLYPA